jgi:A/G-specific adenine glycosylase
MVAAVVRHGGAVLMARRAEGGLFGGLWEPPMVEARTLRSAHARLEGSGARVPLASLERAGRVEHVLTHRELDVLVVRADVARRYRLVRPTTAPYERAAWVEADTADVGISTLARKIIRRASRS